MRRITCQMLIILGAVGTCGAAAAAQPMTATLEKDRVTVNADGKLFCVYKTAPEQKYPYFWPVNGPLSGTSVTTETSEPYPHHHSLFFGCDRVNGANYWQDANGRGQILSQGPKLLEAAGDRVVLSDECLWKQPEQDPVIRDSRRITISAPGETSRYIDFEITIEKTNHSLFSARVVPELSVVAGGTLVNAEGEKGEKGTFGVASAWCDYYGTRKGVTEGLALLQHPANRWFPSKWFTRDYGFFSPTPMYWLEGDRLLLPKGEKLTLRYWVVVHAGDTEAAKIADVFKGYSEAGAKP